MTTTVKITTHGWPARVKIKDKYQTGNVAVDHSETREIPRWSEQQFAITDKRSIEFEELPGWQEKPADPEAPAPDQA
jgi:hypothetical protein